MQATGFVSQLALPSTGPRTPPVLEDSPDPVRGVAGTLVVEALALAGHPADALAQWEGPLASGATEVDQALTGCGPALALLLAGRPADALHTAEVGLRSVERLDAPPAIAALRALRAEALVRLGDVEGAGRHWPASPPCQAERPAGAGAAGPDDPRRRRGPLGARRGGHPAPGAGPADRDGPVASDGSLLAVGVVGGGLVPPVAGRGRPVGSS